MTFLCLFHCFHIWRIPIQSRTGIYALGERRLSVAKVQRIIHISKFISTFQRLLWKEYSYVIKTLVRQRTLVFKTIHRIFLFRVCLQLSGSEQPYNSFQGEANHHLPKREAESTSTLLTSTPTSKEYSFSRAHAQGQPTCCQVFEWNPVGDFWLTRGGKMRFLTNPWGDFWLTRGGKMRFLTNPWGIFD